MALFTAVADPEFAAAAGFGRDTGDGSQPVSVRSDRDKAAQLFD